MHKKPYPLSIVCGFTSVWTPSEKYLAFTLVLVVGLLVQLHMKCITSGFPAIQESYHSLEADWSGFLSTGCCGAQGGAQSRSE